MVRHRAGRLLDDDELTTPLARVANERRRVGQGAHPQRALRAPRRGPEQVASPDEHDLVEAAASLFRLLHEIDATGVTRIAVAPVPHHGLGEAINDRLLRAAAPRDSA